MSDFFSYQPPAEPSRGRPAAPPPMPPQLVLQDLGGDEWEQVLRHAARRRYAAHAVVVALGAAEPALHLVASGRIRIEGPGVAPTLRGEGEVFGSLSFLDGAPSAVSATVTADGPAELLRFTPEALQQLAAWQPRLALQLMRELGALLAARLRGLAPAD